MQKIIVIGNAGSGKTTFSKALAEKTNLPLVHLDKIFWCGKWRHISKEKFDEILGKELKKDSWIIDGNFNRTFPRRLKYCDTVFYFDLPVISCLWGSTVRVIQNYGNTRDDMGSYCPEKFDKHKLELYKSILKFNKQHRERYYKLLSEQKDKKVIIFRTRKDVKKFFKTL